MAFEYPVMDSLKEVGAPARLHRLHSIIVELFPLNSTCATTNDAWLRLLALTLLITVKSIRKLQRAAPAIPSIPTVRVARAPRTARGRRHCSAWWAAAPPNPAAFAGLVVNRWDKRCCDDRVTPCGEKP